MDLEAAANVITGAASLNNDWSAAQAQRQMDFEERMSNTAHQREVEDLKAAGLNPVLSAHSTGATTPTGAMGSTDQGLTSALYGLVKMALESQMTSAQAVEKVAESASGSGKGKASKSEESDIERAIKDAFGMTSAKLAEDDKWNKDREAKKEDTTTQVTENAKLFGFPIGAIGNEAARRKGYDNWAEMVVDDLETILGSNSKVGKKLQSDLQNSAKSVKDVSKKTSKSSSTNSTGDIRALGAGDSSSGSSKKLTGSKKGSNSNSGTKKSSGKFTPIKKSSVRRLTK